MIRSQTAIALCLLAFSAVAPNAAGAMTTVPDEGGPVVVTVKFDIRDGKYPEALQAIREIQQLTHREPGSIQLDLIQQQGKPNSLLYYERWTSHASWQAHVDKPYLTRFHQREADLFIAPPELLLFRKVEPLKD